MKILTAIKKTACNTAFIYTGTSIIFSAIGYQIIGGRYFIAQLVFLLFGFLVSLSFLLPELFKIHRLIKRVFQFVLSFVSFWLCFFVIPQKTDDQKAFFIMSLFFVVIYFIIGGIRLLYLSMSQRKKRKKDEYTQIYS